MDFLLPTLPAPVLELGQVSRLRPPIPNSDSGCGGRQGMEGSGLCSPPSFWDGGGQPSKMASAEHRLLATSF